MSGLRPEHTWEACSPGEEFRGCRQSQGALGIPVWPPGLSGALGRAKGLEVRAGVQGSLVGKSLPKPGVSPSGVWGAQEEKQLGQAASWELLPVWPSQRVGQLLPVRVAQTWPLSIRGKVPRTPACLGVLLHALLPGGLTWALRHQHPIHRSLCPYLWARATS